MRDSNTENAMTQSKQEEREELKKTRKNRVERADGKKKAYRYKPNMVWISGREKWSKKPNGGFWEKRRGKKHGYNEAGQEKESTRTRTSEKRKYRTFWQCEQ